MGILNVAELIDTSMEYETDNEEPIVAHIVGPEGNKTGNARAMEAQVLGIAVTALCGHSWVPTRNPDNLPVCERCLEIVEFAKDMRG